MHQKNRAHASKLVKMPREEILKTLGKMQSNYKNIRILYFSQLVVHLPEALAG